MKQQQQNAVRVYACIHLHMKIGAGSLSRFHSPDPMLVLVGILLRIQLARNIEESIFVRLRILADEED
jgi:hypothetical protein